MNIYSPNMQREALLKFAEALASAANATSEAIVAETPKKKEAPAMPAVGMGRHGSPKIAGPAPPCGPGEQWRRSGRKGSSLLRRDDTEGQGGS